MPSSLPRFAIVIVKAKAFSIVGEYDYDCPHDKTLFEFLGTTAADLSERSEGAQTDKQ